MRYNYDMQPKYYGAAAQYNKPTGGNFGKILKILGLFVGVIVLITIAYFAYTALTSGGKNSAAQLVARQRQLLTFLTANQGSVANDTLKTISGNATSLVTSDHYALSQGIKTEYGLAAVPEAITKAEADTTSTTTLKNAQIQSRFDQVYLQLLREKIASTQELAQSVLSTAGGTLQTATQTTLEHLSTIDEQLDQLKL